MFALGVLLSCRRVASDVTSVSYDVVGASEAMTAASITSASIGVTVTQVDLTIISDTRVIVGNCPLGTWAAPGSDACTSCIAGKYSTTASASAESECKACAPGTWSDTVGASTLSTCKACLNNTYYGGSGGASQSVCQACPQYSSSYMGSTQSTDCVCIPGYSGSNGMLVHSEAVSTRKMIFFCTQVALAQHAVLPCGASTGNPIHVPKTPRPQARPPRWPNAFAIQDITGTPP